MQLDPMEFMPYYARHIWIKPNMITLILFLHQIYVVNTKLEACGLVPKIQRMCYYGEIVIWIPI